MHIAASLMIAMARPSDDDSSGGGLDAPDSARHADGGAESDVSSLTSAE